jgi:type II secretory pathway pseudopilin PulG
MRRRASRQRGSLVTEILVAISILSIAALPLMSSFIAAQRSVRRSYQHAVAMEIIDGEMEILLHGEWREFPQGAQPYDLHGDAAKNLPPGHATLIVSGNHVRLEWTPDRAGGKVVREADAK